MLYGSLDSVLILSKDLNEVIDIREYTSNTRIELKIVKRYHCPLSIAL